MSAMTGCFQNKPPGTQSDKQIFHPKLPKHPRHAVTIELGCRHESLTCQDQGQLDAFRQIPSYKHYITWRMPCFWCLSLLLRGAVPYLAPIQVKHKHAKTTYPFRLER